MYLEKRAVEKKRTRVKSLTKVDLVIDLSFCFVLRPPFVPSTRRPAQKRNLGQGNLDFLFSAKFFGDLRPALLVALSSFFITTPFLLLSRKPSPMSKTEIAQHLSKKKATLYGHEWCIYCKKQLDIFGDDRHLIEYVNCTAPDQRERCARANIQSVPTWEIQTLEGPVRKSGLMNLKELQQWSGFQK